MKRKQADNLCKQTLDPSSREVFYYHTFTKDTLWERPDDYNSEEDIRDEEKAAETVATIQIPIPYACKTLYSLPGGSVAKKKVGAGNLLMAAGAV